MVVEGTVIAGRGWRTFDATKHGRAATGLRLPVVRAQLHAVLLGERREEPLIQLAAARHDGCHPLEAGALLRSDMPSIELLENPFDHDRHRIDEDGPDLGTRLE